MLATTSTCRSGCACRSGAMAVHPPTSRTRSSELSRSQGSRVPRDALEISRGAFHFCALPQAGLTRRRGGETVGRSVQQRHAQALFRAARLAANCRMTHAKSAPRPTGCLWAPPRERSAHRATARCQNPRSYMDSRCEQTNAASGPLLPYLSNTTGYTKRGHDDEKPGVGVPIGDCRAGDRVARARLWRGLLSQDARALSPHTCLSEALLFHFCGASGVGVSDAALGACSRMAHRNRHW